MKRTLFATVFSLMAAAGAFAIEKPFFSGTTGFLTSFGTNKKEDNTDFKPSAEAYFAGQLDFSGKLFLRGEFYTISDSIFEDDMNSENATFRVEEISATYKITGDSASHYLSLFKGNFEPFGSDLFLQRQFGISKISSNLTESYHGIEGASINPLYALGASYTARLEGNSALAFSVYKDKARRKDKEEDNSANFDLRYAGVFDYLTIDTYAGLAFPVESEDDSDGFININEVQFHCGINALFGNKKSAMLFTQFGVDKVILKESDSSDKSLNLKDYYFLVEPRLPFSDFYFNPSVFNFPAKSAEDMIYLRALIAKSPDTENVLGVNFNIVNENLYAGSSRITAGIHGTLAYTEIDNNNLKKHFSSTMKDAESTFIITPYTNIEVFGGSLTASLSIDTDELSDSVKKAVTLTAGFKTKF
ncbi:MAG: hypothetical protein SPJ89_01475 [Treponema sp.]|nr:hypothetical protein [Spirochaetia bacterium]MDD7460031.1 hypothetical protein [Spirochaetales bacterium]MDY5810627.1 hypothetical protein [Treponema sp.]